MITTFSVTWEEVCSSILSAESPVLNKTICYYNLLFTFKCTYLFIYNIHFRNTHELYKINVHV